MALTTIPAELIVGGGGGAQKEVVTKYLTGQIDDFNDNNSVLPDLTVPNLVVGQKYTIFFKMAYFCNSQGSSVSFSMEYGNGSNQVVNLNGGYNDSDFDNFSELTSSETALVTFVAQDTSLVGFIGNVGIDYYILGYGSTEGTYLQIWEADDMTPVTDFTI